MIRVLERPVSQLTHHIILSRSKHIVDGPLPRQLRHPPPTTAQGSGHGMQVQTHSPSNQRQAKDTLACDTQRAHGRSQDRYILARIISRQERIPLPSAKYLIINRYQVKQYTNLVCDPLIDTKTFSAYGVLPLPL